MSAGLAGAVAELLVQPETVGQVDAGLVVFTEPGAGAGQEPAWPRPAPATSPDGVAAATAGRWVAAHSCQ